MRIRTKLLLTMMVPLALLITQITAVNAFIRELQSAVSFVSSAHSLIEADLAAADLIVQEAGGSVTDLNGARMRYNEVDTVHRGIVGADRKFHRRLLSHTRGWKPND